MLSDVALRSGLAALVLIAILSSAVAVDEPDREQTLERVRAEISRLERELGALRTEEKGVLGELRKLDGELRLRQSEHDEISLRLDQVTAAIAEHDRTLGDLEQAQARRRSYLAFRLREVYKAGPEQSIRHFLGDAEVEDYWSGVGYAIYLSERDSQVLQDFRVDGDRLDVEREALVQAGQELVGIRAASEQARENLEATRRRHATALRRIREDRESRRSALEELEAAAQELTRVVDAVQVEQTEAGPDIRQFRGLLDLPADGEIGAAFGTVVHPQFKTRVPHPGWDIEAGYGADIASIFDGQVVFCEWMRGYGLTAIVDHGNGLLSIYAHASVLMVEPGERVRRGRRWARSEIRDLYGVHSCISSCG